LLPFEPKLALNQLYAAQITMKCSLFSSVDENFKGIISPVTFYYEEKLKSQT
jgi:hypothetical protein